MTYFYSIKLLKDNQIFSIIKDLNLQYSTVLLSFMTKKRASNILKMFDKESQIEITKRLVSLKEVKEKYLKVLDNIFTSKIHKITEINGTGAALEILESMEGKTTFDILEKIESETPTISKELKEYVKPFTLDKSYDLD